MPVERSNAELVEFSPRLLHSLQIYFGLARALTRVRIGFDPEPAWETSSAQVESFAMHTRGLADFYFKFQRTGRHAKHDAFAFDFFASAEHWRRIIGEPGPWLRRARFQPEKGSAEEYVDRFGAQIAHLNYKASPASDFARGWPVMQLASEIGAATARFVAEVDDGKVAPDFKDKAWREIPVVARLEDAVMPLAAWTRPSLRLPAS